MLGVEVPPLVAVAAWPTWQHCYLLDQELDDLGPPVIGRILPDLADGLIRGKLRGRLVDEVPGHFRFSQLDGFVGRCEHDLVVGFGVLTAAVLGDEVGAVLAAAGQRFDQRGHAVACFLRRECLSNLWRVKLAEHRISDDVVKRIGLPEDLAAADDVPVVVLALAVVNAFRHPGFPCPGAATHDAAADAAVQQAGEKVLAAVNPLGVVALS